MGHSVKTSQGYILKNEPHFETWVTLLKIGKIWEIKLLSKKMGHIWKNVSPRDTEYFSKMGRSVKNRSHNKKWATLWKNGLHFEKWVWKYR